MNTVRSCIAAASVLLIAFGSRATSATECCNPNSTSGGGGDIAAGSSCRNRTFQANETYGGAPCDDKFGAVPVRKCCPANQTYDPEARLCRPATAVAADPDETVDAAFRRLLLFEGQPFPPPPARVGYFPEPPTCESGYMLVDVPADDVRRLLDNVTATDRQPFPADHCLDMTFQRPPKLVARTCRPRYQYCRGNYTCINKCCRADKMIVGVSCRSNYTSVPFHAPVYDTADNGSLILSNNMALSYYGRLQCDRHMLNSSSYKVLVDGSILRADVGRRVPATNYCLEYTKIQLLPIDLVAYVCLDDESAVDAKGSVKYKIMLVSFIPSIVCLAFTLIVYAMLASLRNVHGYYVMCYVACLLLSFICLLIIQWWNDMHENWCELFGYLTLFAFLATFCWLNVICFDIYWMLRYNNSIIKSATISLRSILYNIYCWGLSIIYTYTAFSFQHSSDTRLQNLAPDIGVENCWISNIDNDYGTVIFFLLPVSVMLVANLILFVLTAIHCSRIKSELNKFKRTDSKTQRFQVNKEKFVMSIKLFLVMGIPWSFEILCRVFQNDWFIWDILDEINALQGVMIFVIFVAKRKVLTNLRKKISGSLDHSDSTKINTISGSSQSGSSHKNNYDF